MAEMADRMIQETRRQKSGSTAGEKSKANSRQYELKLGEVVTTIPTIDSNVENVEYTNLSDIVLKDTEMIN